MQAEKSSSEGKYSRILDLYSRLINGGVINKAEEAERYGKSVRSIQYDIDDLRAYFSDKSVAGEPQRELVYDQKINGYYLKTIDENVLSNSEILAVCKILLESRAFCKDDITTIVNKLLSNCIPQNNRKMVEKLVSNELFHYIEPQHKKHFIELLWNIGEAVAGLTVLKIRYERSDGKIVDRTIQPVGIMFSEFYFYLTAFIDGIDKGVEFDNPDDLFPTIYRIDRIQKMEITDTHFYIPYKNRFEEGEFRKRIQFMTGGKLRRVKFLFKGVNPEPVIDRLPTAKIVEHTNDGYVFTAEVFGDGVDMWLKSQGDSVEVL